MHVEAHGNDLNNTLHRENISENESKKFYHLIVLSECVSILVIEKGEHNGVYENERNNEVVEPRPAGQPYDFAADTSITFEQVTATPIVDYELFVHFWEVKMCAFDWLDLNHNIILTTANMHLLFFVHMILIRKKKFKLVCVQIHNGKADKYLFQLMK